MVPQQTDNSFACDFTPEHVCGYTSNTAYINTMSRVLIQHDYYLVFGVQDTGSEAALLSPVVTVTEETCLQIYMYCKECREMTGDYRLWLQLRNGE